MFNTLQKCTVLRKGPFIKLIVKNSYISINFIFGCKLTLYSNIINQANIATHKTECFRAEYK